MPVKLAPAPAPIPVRPAPLEAWRASWPAQRGDRRRPALVAARGIGRAAPEHTLAALELAAAIGAGWVSVEVRRTADGELVLLRSSDLRGTTDVVSVLPDRAPFRVEDLTLEEVRLLDVGGGVHPSFAGERITTLAAALDRLGGRVGVIVDIPIGPRTAGIDRLVAVELAARPELHTLGPRVAVRSRDVLALETVAELVPGTATLYRLGPSAVRDSLALVPDGVDGVTVPSSALDAELVARARAAGRVLTVDRVTTLAEAEHALRLGVAGVETDDALVLAGAARLT